MNQIRVLGLVMIAVGMSAAVLAGTLKIELPQETASLLPGPGADLANGQCLTCHSADYITTQPRDKPLAFWKAEVEKMRKVYAAPVPDDQIQAIAEYLTRSYGSTNP
ncbi:MAG: cytochrome c [Proteobacteria bacterium]|nr:cytochrome c [Pseudomonadota bacterium]